MSKQREALQMALDALIEVTGWQWVGPMRVMDEVEDAIAAIREALAESFDPVQDAAHDLLEALITLNDSCRTPSQIGVLHGLELARAAIAKAKGEV